MSEKPDYLKSLPNDLLAGLVVFLVALPLCLGVALGSNAPLISGIVGGLVGGLLVAWLSGSHTSVSGPSPGLTAIVFVQIGNVGSFEAFLVAVILAGVLQIIMGALKAGSLAAFFPSSVIKGMLAAIGINLILKQIPHLFGHDSDWLGNMDFLQMDGENTFSEIFATFSNIHPGAMVIGLVSLVWLIGWNKSPLKKLPLPSALVVVILGLVGVALLQPVGSVWTVGTEHLVQVPVTDSISGLFESLHFPDFSSLASSGVYVAAITVAIVACLESMLNLQAIDKLDPKKRVSPPNRELVAQGVGNVTCGMLGGLPITSVIVRSSVNISSGGQTRMASFYHGVFLLLLFLFLPALLNRVPLACLSAILIVTGFGLTRPALYKQMWRAGRNQFLPFIVTVVAIIFTDLLVGIIIGLLVATAFILASNLNRPLRRIEEVHLSEKVTRIVLANQVSFLNRAALQKTLNEVPEGGHLVLDARQSHYIDSDIQELIRDFAKETAPVRDLKISLVGFKEHYDVDDRVLYFDYVTPEVQAQMDSAKVVDLLKDGNERFVKGEPVVQETLHQVGATAAAQYPLAVVLACMDSRIATEKIFDLGLGDIFSVRNAGNTAGAKELGSLEYACAVSGAKLLVVLGHTRCGAIGATIDLIARGADVKEATGCDHLPSVTDEIAASVQAETTTKTNRTAENEDFTNHVSELNVRRTMTQILEKSSTLQKLVEEGKLLLVGGIYDLKSGRVEFLEEKDN